MKKLTLAFIFSFSPFLQGHIFAQAETNNLENANNRVIENTAFKVGEYLKYRIHYGFIDAGIAELKIEANKTIQNRPTFHIVGTGRTTGMAEWFFKTRDRYETYIDMDSLVPLEFIRDVDEGGFKINRHIVFNHNDNKAVDLKDQKKSYKIFENSQDLLSTFYYARCLEVKNVKVGDQIPVSMFLDHEMFTFSFKYLGEEVLKTSNGKIKCKKFTPLVQEGRVFNEKEGMTLWVSADKNQLPIRMETELAVGSITIDLVDYENLRHPIVFRK